MRPNKMTRRHDRSSTESDYMEHDAHIVSLLLLADPGTKTSIQSSYQGMINMLDSRLQVLCTTDKNSIRCFSDDNTKKKQSSSDAIPSLSIVLFFNRGSGAVERRQQNGFSRPDLLQNHIFNHNSETKHCHRKQNSRTCDDGRQTPKNKNFTVTENEEDRGRESPFLRYDIILKESREREKRELFCEGHDENLSKSFDMESSVATLEARKQLQTWPWEFHHRAATTKGITQCQSNAQDFYVYQPDQEVTRLYGDVIDTSKISRKMNCLGIKEKDVYDEMLDNTLQSNHKFSSTQKHVTTSATEYPLMAVREVHYGRQHLRYMMFVSDTTWKKQVEFYRLLLRRHVVTLRDDFCFFTVHSGEETDVQFALKKLNQQSSVCLSSTVLQFKVRNVGHLVPLLPHSCQPVSETKWRTRDHDGNVIVLDIAQSAHVTDETISNSHRKHHPLDVGRASHSEIDSKLSSEEEFSLERLDSFVEPKLPDRMPLLKPHLYTDLARNNRFSSRTTSGSSPCSSSSNSPERKPLQFRFTPRIQKMFPDRSSPAICSNTPQPHRASTPVRFPTRSQRSGSLFSESSDEPENTNFYRRAKMQNDATLSNGKARQQVPGNQVSKQRHHKRRLPKPAVYQKEQLDELEFYV